jgi:hypothetical protein
LLCELVGLDEIKALTEKVEVRVSLGVCVEVLDPVTLFDNDPLLVTEGKFTAADFDSDELSETLEEIERELDADTLNELDGDSAIGGVRLPDSLCAIVFELLIEGDVEEVDDPLSEEVKLIDELALEEILSEIELLRVFVGESLMEADKVDDPLAEAEGVKLVDELALEEILSEIELLRVFVGESLSEIEPLGVCVALEEILSEIEPLSE